MLCSVLFVILVLQHGVVASKSSCTEEDMFFHSQEGVCGCALRCPFSHLEKAMMRGENQYKLWTTFHHPREAFPQLLVVKYSTINSDFNISATYLWTSNAIYLVIPPHMFGLLSLFLGVLDGDHTGRVNLTLPENCSCWLKEQYQSKDDYATLNRLEVLTEKVSYCLQLCIS